MKLFGKIKLDDNEGAHEITRHNNFRSFPRALMVLFRSATGESWQEIMYSILVTKACDPLSRPSKDERVSSEPEDCSSWVSIPYFVSFVCLCSFLVAHLYIKLSLSFSNLFYSYSPFYYTRSLTCSLPSLWTISTI